jgi:hypothetical protein
VNPVLAKDGVGTRGALEKFGGDAEGGRGKTDGAGAGGKGGDMEFVGDVEGGKDAGEGTEGDSLGVNALSAALIFATSTAALFLVFIAFRVVA